MVETQYVGKGEPGSQAVQERRFSDGEIQYLLQDWPTASVLFYDLVSDKSFDGNPKRPDALWYLGRLALPAGQLRLLPPLPPGAAHPGQPPLPGGAGALPRGELQAERLG